MNDEWISEKFGPIFSNIIGRTFIGQHLRLTLTKDQLDREILDLVADGRNVDDLRKRLPLARFWIKMTDRLAAMYTYDRKPIHSCFKWQDIAKRFFFVIYPNVSKLNSIHADKLKQCLDHIFVTKQFDSMNDLISDICSSDLNLTLPFIGRRSRSCSTSTRLSQSLAEQNGADFDQPLDLVKSNTIVGRISPMLQSPPRLTTSIVTVEEPMIVDQNVIEENPPLGGASSEVSDNTELAVDSDSSMKELIIADENLNSHKDSEDLEYLPVETILEEEMAGPSDMNKSSNSKDPSDISPNTEAVLKKLVQRQNKATVSPITRGKNVKRIKLLPTTPVNTSDITESNEDFDWLSVPGCDQPSTASHSRIKFSILGKKIPYSNGEDADIIRYIITTSRYDDVKGNALWKQMENENVCHGRTWQSLKNRYIKNILPNLILYAEFLNIDTKTLELLQSAANNKTAKTKDTKIRMVHYK